METRILEKYIFDLSLHSFINLWLYFEINLLISTKVTETTNSYLYVRVGQSGIKCGRCMRAIDENGGG